jgi:hypothetical protein
MIADMADKMSKLAAETFIFGKAQQRPGHRALAQPR